MSDEPNYTSSELRELGLPTYAELNADREYLKAQNADLDRLSGSIEEAMNYLQSDFDLDTRNEIVSKALAILAKATPKEPLTLADLHQAHYRVCNCLGDSAECCQKGCACHRPKEPA